MSKRILIVEDEKDIRELLCAVFGDQQQYELFYAEDGQKALNFILSTKPDIVLLDINLPQLSGYDLCQRIKSDPNTRHIKVLMLSALVQQEDFLKSQAAGADGHITKPFNVQELIDTVNRLI